MPGMQMSMSPAGWQWMQDGVVYGLLNRQGGPRGDQEFVVPNWWMGMLMREKGAHQFGLNAMLSLDAATVGWLEQHLPKYEGTIIAVTHDRYFLDNIAGWIF